MLEAAESRISTGASPSRTASGDYSMPGPATLTLANFALRSSGLLPGFLSKRVLARHKYYQEFDEATVGAAQGLSLNKWQVMRLPDSLAGKSVLDIGCAEGFFCHEAARLGARPVVGVDTRFGALLCAALMARDSGLQVRYHMGIFPRLGLEQAFDYVFCLSVLHHLVSTKDIWKVLSDPAHLADREVLLGHARALAGLTARGGRCIIELPYEYESEESRASVDFGRFHDLLVEAGFERAENLGSWGHAQENRDKKDRIIYSAHAPGA